jgi:hypothetical protein
MKKNAILFVLFVLPIVAYLFFASGINSFSKLPVVTSGIPELGEWKGLHNEQLTLTGKITVLGFGGDVLKNRGNLFNLCQKIYKPYHEFSDLQIVIVCPDGTQNDAKYILDQFATFTDVSKWHFVFAPKAEIETFYAGMKLQGKLDENAGTPSVYIVDKERNLRGRKGDEYKEGYNSFHLSDLSNKMVDDFKIILYEYRAALKKNHNATKEL